MALRATEGKAAMKKKCIVWIAFFTLTVTLGCRTPSPGWNGTWKLNSAKSNFQGPVFSISNSVRDVYEYNDGKAMFTFLCDGKEHSIGNNHTESCVIRGLTSLDIAQKDNGVSARITHWELSADGKAFTSTVTVLGANGPTTISQIVFSRLSGSNGFEGRWRDISYIQQHADMILRLDNEALHIAYPSAGQYIDAPFEGAVGTVHGPHVPNEATYVVRIAGRHKFLTIAKRNGKVATAGSLELSNDGRTVTDTWWNPDQPAEKGTLVYEKQ